MLFVEIALENDLHFIVASIFGEGILRPDGRDTQTKID
jgi:hypothetical protein